MTGEEAIVLLNCSINELIGTLAGIPCNESAADQIKRYIEAYEMGIAAIRAQKEKSEQEDKLKRAMRRLGEFGKLFVDYRGDPRGPCFRPCIPLTEEVFEMPILMDVDGGKWIPVNADALKELADRYERMRDQKGQNSPCDLCCYDPPSSMGGKPCFMCPAAPRQEELEE